MVTGLGVRGRLSGCARPLARGRRLALGRCRRSRGPGGGGCGLPADAEAGPGTVRLIEKFDAKKVEGAAAEKAVRALPRTEWRFDGSAPKATGAMPPSGAAAGGRPSAFPVTRGFEAGPGIAGLAVRDGLLVGRSTTGEPILHLERTSGLDNADQLHSVVVRMRVSKGANLHFFTRPSPTVDLKAEAALPRTCPAPSPRPSWPGRRCRPTR